MTLFISPRATHASWSLYMTAAYIEHDLQITLNLDRLDSLTAVSHLEFNPFSY